MLCSQESFAGAGQAPPHPGSAGFLEPWIDGSEASRERRRATAATASSPRPSRSLTTRSSKLNAHGVYGALMEGSELAVPEIPPYLLGLFKLPCIQLPHVQRCKALQHSLVSSAPTQLRNYWSDSRLAATPRWSYTIGPRPSLAAPWRGRYLRLPLRYATATLQVHVYRCELP